MMYKTCDVLGLIFSGDSIIDANQLGQLLIDKTTGYGVRYNDEPLTVSRVRELYDSGEMVTRTQKAKQVQKDRTKKKAEVFTPTWVVKKMNNAVEENYKDDDINTYIGRTWLEITCGEGPYITTRYNMEDGVIIPPYERVGFLDNKLNAVNEEVGSIGNFGKDHDGMYDRWFDLAIKALKSSYGFEWSGDSLLLCRLNVLTTFLENHYIAHGFDPDRQAINQVIDLITYNFWQMDGLSYMVPNTDTKSFITDWDSNTFHWFGEGLPESDYMKKKRKAEASAKRKAEREAKAKEKEGKNNENK